jgi:hypothetical protein
VKIGELFVDLMIDGAGGAMTISDLTSRMGDLEIAALGDVSILATLAVGIAKLSDQAMEAAASMFRFESQTGLSAEKLQMWQAVGEQAAVSADAVASSVAGLERNLAAIRMGQGNIAPFQILGIVPGMDAFETLNKIRRRLRGVDAPTAVNLLSQMGLDPSMIQMLRLTDQQFAKMAANRRLMSKAQQQMFMQERQGLVSLRRELQFAGVDIAEFFGERVTSMLDNALFLVQKIESAVRAVAAAFREWHSIGMLLIAALLTIGLYFAPITTAVVLLSLLFDDLLTYLRGGKSLIGEWMKLLDPLIDKLADWIQKYEHVTQATPYVAQQMAARSITQSNSLTQNIQTTAPAADVARHSVDEHIQQIIDHTDQLVGNQ